MIGLKSPAVDAILSALVHAQTREQLVDATHALDRVLMHGYYVVPHWYSATHRVAFKRGLAWPKTLPLYYARKAGSRRCGGIAQPQAPQSQPQAATRPPHSRAFAPETPPCGATSSNACC